MKYLSAILIIAVLILASANHKVHAQTVQILGNNTLNGAINGVALGAASMLMVDKKVNAPFTKNMDDLYALQVGLGLGTLFGVGMGAYDVVSGSGNELLVSGFFNDATNTSAIVLMDTFYGAAAGTLISVSITLLSESPNGKDVKTGAGVGAWVGFGFGIFDAFVLADRSTEPVAYLSPKNDLAPGLASIQFTKSTSVGLLNPGIIQVLDIGQHDVSGRSNSKIDLVNFRLNF